MELAEDFGNGLQHEDPAPEKAAEFNLEGNCDIDQTYLNEIRKIPLLSAEEERNLARLARGGDFDARQKMISHNLRLVVKIARHYVNRGMMISDLIEEGNLGLMHAIEKFDPELGYRFSTYATWWIRQNIERATMNQFRTIRLPIHVLRVVNSIRREMQAAPGRKKAADVADCLGIPVENVWHALQNSEWIISLDVPLDMDPALSIGDAIPDEQTLPPDRVLEEEEMQKIVMEWLGSLDARQQIVIENRYGFGSREILTLAQLAKCLGVTRERVRQIQNESLDCLRKRCADQGIVREMLL